MSVNTKSQHLHSVHPNTASVVVSSPLVILSTKEHNMHIRWFIQFST